jgi:methylated-DNA-[protein]-cysteine S-methyltransferase
MEHMNSLQAVAIIETPIGRVAIGATDKGVADVEIVTPKKSRTAFENSPIAGQHAATAAQQLGEYFEGNRKDFSVPFDLQGTEFQRSVWAQVAQIGHGEKLSYGEIASKLNKPKAARAVGGAVGANPVPLLIGCHRVLGNSQSLTGYSGGEGLRTKLWLLSHEGIEHR